MKISQIEKAIIGALKDVQEMSGRAWSEVTGSSVPIGDVDGFDSLCSVEATLMVEERLGFDDLGFDSIFISDDGLKALSIGEIAKRVQKILKAKGGNG